MKIAFIGANDLVVDFINAVALNHDVMLYEEGALHKPLVPGVRRYALKKHCFGLERISLGEVSLPFAMRGLSRRLREDAPDVIIVMDYIRVWYWQALAYRLNKPDTRLIMYAETRHMPRSFLSRIAFMVFLAVFRVSEKCVWKTFVYTQFGYDFARRMKFKKSPILMTVPVDTEAFYPEPEERSGSSDMVHILMNARFVSYKNHKDVLHALSRLTPSERARLHVSFIGRGGEGKHQVESLVTELSLNAVVSFLPAVAPERMRECYLDHDLLLLPSRDEAVGMVVPEAMACGLPTVTSDTVGALVYVEEGKTGFVFKTGDVDALARLLRNVSNSSELRRMGEAAAARVQDRFSVPVRTHAFMDEVEEGNE